MHGSVIRFFDANVSWLSRVLADGRAEGALSFDGSAADTAQALLGTLQGAMLVARPYGDLVRFQASLAPILASLGGVARGAA